MKIWKVDCADLMFLVVRFDTRLLRGVAGEVARGPIILQVGISINGIRLGSCRLAECQRVCQDSRTSATGRRC